MATLFSPPDQDILSDSSNTVYLSEPVPGREGLIVIPITAIRSVVSMFPEMAISQAAQITRSGKYSLMRHPYVDLTKYLTEGFVDDNDDTV